MDRNGAGGLTRRRFGKKLLAASALCFVPNPLASVPERLLASPQRAPQAYDLLIQGGTVVDPSQNLHARLDVAIADGTIAELANDIPINQAREVIPASGKIVSPGLIDIHSHVYEGVGLQGIAPDRGWLAKGVTTVVDGGSAGFTTVAGLLQHVVSRSQTRVFVLVDIGMLGLVAGIRGAMLNLDYLKPLETAAAVIDNKPVTVGVKVRLSKSVVGTQDLEALQRAREAAEAAGVPMMVHIGDTHSPLPEILRRMRTGDIITHCFHPDSHGLLDGNGKILPEVLEARQRGIFFDVGHGNSHFGFDVTERCLRQGFLPDTISSDLTTRTVNGPVFDLLTILSKFLALDLGLEEVIQTATANAARVFDFGLPLGTLRKGSEADIAILELRDGSFRFTDSRGNIRAGNQKLFPYRTIRSGKLIEPLSG